MAIHVDKKLPLRRRRFLYQLPEPSILFKAKAWEPAPFKSSNTENNPIGISLPEKIQGINLSLRSSCIHEYAICFFEFLPYIEKIVYRIEDSTKIDGFAAMSKQAWRSWIFKKACK